MTEENANSERKILELVLDKAEARGALAMIRAIVEPLIPPGTMRPREELDWTFAAEALEIIRGG
jgi:hypothetical protein